MKKSELQFLSVLKEFAQGNAATLSCDAEIEEITKFGNIHNLTPVLGYALNRHIKENLNDNMAAKKLSDLFLQTFMFQHKRIILFEKLLDKLNAEKVKTVLIKGCVVKKYYPDPEIRTFGDIDFLVQEKDIKKTDKIMLELGYSKYVEEGAVWGYKKGAENYEIHTALLPNEEVLNAKTKEFVSSAFSYVVPTDREYVFELEPSYHFIFLLLHTAKHMINSGAGVRMYLDLAMMIKNEPQLDFSYITETCENLGMLKFLNCALFICRKWFEIFPDIESVSPDIESVSPDVDTLNLMEEYIISAGIFGFYNRNPAVSRIRNTDKGVSKFAALKNYVFPSYEEMKSSYRFLNGRPYLLPLVWVIRLFDGVFLRRKRAAKIFKGMFTEGEQAKITGKMLKEIGLDIRLK